MAGTATTTPRPARLFSRGHVIAWLVSLALGIGWVLALGALPSDMAPLVQLFLALVGLFGFGLGVLIATGLLVKALSLSGTRPGSISTSAGELPVDLVFGVCVMLFCAPSLSVYLGV